MQRHICVLVALSFAILTAPASAYNPPVDKVGAVTVRIEGPETVAQTDVPLPVRVVVENKGGQPVEGTLVVKVIDRWRVEPAGEVKFRAAANGAAAAEFKVTAGAGTYAAHYPIHVYARFEADGKPQTAHPILILEAKLPTKRGQNSFLRGSAENGTIAPDLAETSSERL